MAKGRSRRNQRDDNYISRQRRLENDISQYIRRDHTLPVDPDVRKDLRYFTPTRIRTADLLHPVRTVRKEIRQFKNIALEKVPIINTIRREVICARRKLKRQVLFALKKTNKGSGSKHRKFTDDSKIKCR